MGKWASPGSTALTVSSCLLVRKATGMHSFSQRQPLCPGVSSESAKYPVNDEHQAQKDWGLGGWWMELREDKKERSVVTDSCVRITWNITIQHSATAMQLHNEQHYQLHIPNQVTIEKLPRTLGVSSDPHHSHKHPDHLIHNTSTSIQTNWSIPFSQTFRLYQPDIWSSERFAAPRTPRTPPLAPLSRLGPALVPSSERPGQLSRSCRQQGGAEAGGQTAAPCWRRRQLRSLRDLQLIAFCQQNQRRCFKKSTNNGIKPSNISNYYMHHRDWNST